jgi:hypothetical protein
MVPMTRYSDSSDWLEIESAPFDCDLELAVIDGDGVHVLVFPCRRVEGGWLNPGSDRRVEIHPTHWRPWEPAN